MSIFLSRYIRGNVFIVIATNSRCQVTMTRTLFRSNGTNISIVVRQVIVTVKLSILSFVTYNSVQRDECGGSVEQVLSWQCALDSSSSTRIWWFLGLLNRDAVTIDLAHFVRCMLLEMLFGMEPVRFTARQLVAASTTSLRNHRTAL